MKRALLVGYLLNTVYKSVVTVGRLHFDRDSEHSGNVPTIPTAIKVTFQQFHLCHVVMSLLQTPTELSDEELYSLYEWFLAEDERQDGHENHPQAHFICSAACLREMKLPRWQYFKFVSFQFWL